MLEIRETRLPGVGIRLEFMAKSGGRVGVIIHRNGRRDVIVCSPHHPDECHEVLNLDEEETHALIEALGASHITEEAARLQLALGGMAIDWIEVPGGSGCSGRTLHEIEHLEQHAASVVAVVRDGETIASPPSTFVIRSGDTAVLVGTREGVNGLADLLTVC